MNAAPMPPMTWSNTAIIVDRYITPGYSSTTIASVATIAFICSNSGIIISTGATTITTATATTASNISIIIYVDIISGYSETSIATRPPITTITQWV
ncbi:hypothetical protein AC87_4890 [Escherichia coli 3-105-05_S4_C1]|nr:hypothetical protein AC87_4890 [Escherichia coli 3-105-05_S4_C1]